MRLALATCSSLPAHEHDDAPLHRVLRERGVELEQPVWDDPGVDWSRYAAVLVRTVWDYHAKHDAFLAWVARVGAQTRLFNPAPVLAWNSDKHYLRELEAAGVAVAPTVWLERGRAHDLSAALDAADIRGRALLKPVVGANALGTLRFDARDAQARAAAQAHVDRLTPTVGLMVQPYLASVEREGELSGFWFDGALSHAVRKRPVAGDYRVQDDYGAHDEPCELDAEALATCEATLGALEAVARVRGWLLARPLLYARVDLLRDDRHAPGAWVLNELELIEPSLFFRHAPGGPAALADALLRRL